MNFMRGKIIKKDSKLYFDEGKIQVKLVEDMYKKMANYTDQEVFFG